MTETDLATLLAFFKASRTASFSFAIGSSPLLVCSPQVGYRAAGV